MLDLRDPASLKGLTACNTEAAILDETELDLFILGDMLLSICTL